MKTTLCISAAEAEAVIEGLETLARENGWIGELQHEVVQEYTRVIDTAFNQLGITLEIEDDEEVEENADDYDIDRTISDAINMLFSEGE